MAIERQTALFCTKEFVMRKLFRLNLAIFPKFKVDSTMLQKICDKLNDIDWQELGFVCDGRFLFSQRSLENVVLDSSFMR